jgi:multicomponent Na+:H+ antiporter subunit G
MQILAGFIISAGLAFMAFGVLGSIILPDLLTRSHAATKCGITGTVTVLAGLSVFTGQLDFVLKLLFIIGFTFFTAPIISHVIAVGYLRRRAEEDER